MSPSGQRARQFRLHDLRPRRPDARAEVLAGLSRQAKAVPPKFFYDAAGSRLFDAITRLPEYYLTRVETGILRANRAALAKAVGADVCLIEYGSGSSVKSRLLLESCRPALYVPVDISLEHLLASARGIFEEFDWLSVCPACADYSRPFTLPAAAHGLPRMGFFPGSSIGNFEPARAASFLAGVAEVVGPRGRLIVGVDLKKDADVLDAAYNDAAGTTRAFNLNMLSHLNHALGANFQLDQFEHVAAYNEGDGRVEMHLKSATAQTVRVDGADIAFRAGERIHTENSYKYAPEEFFALAAEAGFVPRERWQDARGYFMVALLENAGVEGRSLPDGSAAAETEAARAAADGG